MPGMEWEILLCTVRLLLEEQYVRIIIPQKLILFLYRPHTYTTVLSIVQAPYIHLCVRALISTGVTSNQLF